MAFLMNKKNYLRILFTFITAILFFSSAEAASPCDALASGDHAATNEYQQGYPMASIADLNFSISLLDYSTYIDAALSASGGPLPTTSGTELSIPACASLSRSNVVFNNPQTPTGTSIGFAVMGTPWASNPDYANLTNQSDPSFTIGAKITGYCSCGFEWYTPPTCQGMFTPSGSGGSSTIFLNTPGGAVFTHDDPGGNNIGVCADGATTGGLFFSLFAPPGQIPYVGHYTGNVELVIGPPGL
jgi:hypothetical protein